MSASLRTVSAVIPAYAMDRWPLTRRAVESIRQQTVPVESVVLCIDNNPELLARAEAEWRESRGTPVHVVPSRYDRVPHRRTHASSRGFGAGLARNTGAAHVGSDIIAFIDDDAWAEPDWLERLLPLYSDPSIVAVGGAALPEYETSRPPWFPPNFDWVFGCTYDGLPATAAPLRRLLGSSMTVRRDAFLAVGGFRDEPLDRQGTHDFDDLSLSLLLEARYGANSLYYTPDAVVHHYVKAERVTWRYFYRRCYLVNREKVHLFDNMGPAANLAAEREFVWRVLRRQVAAEAKRGLHGEPAAFLSLGAMLAGTVFAAAGYLHGQWEQRLRPALP